MTEIAFVVEEAGCESCAALVRGALEPLAVVEAVEIDADADVASVRVSGAETISEEDVQRALDAASEGAGHRYRVRTGSWQSS